MKLFQSVQKNFAVLGIIRPSQPIQTQYHFNKKILKISLWFCLEFILNGTFLAFVACTFREYTHTIYTTSASIMVIIYYAILVFKTAKLFELIDNFEKVFEKVIDGSEYTFQITIQISKNHLWTLTSLGLEYPAANEIHIKTNRKAEKCCGIIYFMLGKVTPVMWIWPKSIVCLITYLTTNADNDALQLPVSMWWVQCSITNTFGIFLFLFW